MVGKLIIKSVRAHLGLDHKNGYVSEILGWNTSKKQAGCEAPGLSHLIHAAPAIPAIIETHIVKTLS